MDDGSFDIDPEIAAAMGFGGFGTQPGKKRKFDDGAFVDPASTKSNAPQGKGANSLPLGTRRPDRALDQAKVKETPDEASGTQDNSAAATEEEQLQALRYGVRNVNGDMVYFLPSFLEDPWKNLQAR